ncbi:MAG: hypothetical protein AB7T38_04260 [Nitrospirales bacterium]
MSNPLGESNRKKAIPPELDSVCLDRVNLPNIEERKASTRTGGLAGHKSNSSSLGQVLIVSEDSMVREFLGRMLGLLGYDNHSLQEWLAIHVGQSWQGFDAIFLESHFLNRLGNAKGREIIKSQGFPMVVVLASKYGDDLFPTQDSGMFRVLRKPLDYRQMGNIMDECFYMKLQAEEGQGQEESDG